MDKKYIALGKIWCKNMMLFKDIQFKAHELLDSLAKFILEIEEKHTTGVDPEDSEQRVLAACSICAAMADKHGLSMQEFLEFCGIAWTSMIDSRNRTIAPK